MGLYAQNLLKIKTTYIFLNFDLAKGGFSPFSPPWMCPYLHASIVLIMEVYFLFANITGYFRHNLYYVVNFHLFISLYRFSILIHLPAIQNKLRKISYGGLRSSGTLGIKVFTCVCFELF